MRNRVMQCKEIQSGGTSEGKRKFFRKGLEVKKKKIES